MLRVKFLIVSLVLTLVLTVCATSQSEAPVTLVYGHFVAITKLSPDHGTYLGFPCGYEAAMLIYDQLVNLDEHMNLVPGLATSWEPSPDGISWTIHLREGVRFHNGHPFDAQVACWNVEKWMDKEWDPTDRSLRDPLAGCEVLDQYTIKISTHGIFGPLPRALAFQGHAITDPAVYQEKGYEWYATHPVGTGPFSVEEFVVGKRLVLVANAEYWGGRPAVDRIIFEYLPDPYSRVAALKAGEIDVAGKIPPHLAKELEAYPGLRVDAVPGSRVVGLYLYLLHKPLDDVRVRRAISLAMPRKQIAEKLLMGYSVPADSHLALTLPGYVSVGTIEQDLTGAANLLTQAGWVDTDGDGVRDKEGKPLELTLLTPEGYLDLDVQISEVVAEVLKEIGIRVNLRKVEVAAYWGELRLKPSEMWWDIALFGYLSGNGDSWYPLDAMYRSKLPDVTADLPPVEWNIMRYYNPQVNALLDELRRTVDKDRQMELLAHIQRILWEDMPSVPLHTDAFLAVAKKEIKGPLYWANGLLVLSKAYKE